MGKEISLSVTPAVMSLLRHSEQPYNNDGIPLDAASWKAAVARNVVLPGDEILHGGHRNLVVRKSGGNELHIVWRQSDIRWQQIIKGVLIEDAMARHFDIRGRILVNPDEPVTMNDEGLLMTRVMYTPGESRYPYNTDEITSAVELMGKMHAGLKNISFDGEGIHGETHRDSQWLHGDFGRANVLFHPNTASAAAVIDYENATVGLPAQDVGRMASLLLVDTKLPNGDVPTTLNDELIADFSKRIKILLAAYPFSGFTSIPQQKTESIVYACGYLLDENFGSLNTVRDMALHWITREYDLRP